MRDILTDAEVKSAPSRSKPFRLQDGPGLFLLVNKKTRTGRPGSKSWQYRYRIDGQSKIFTIGKYPAITLKEARQRHLEAERLVGDGICPVEHKHEQIRIQKVEQEAQQHADEKSFEAVARDWYTDARDNWKSEKYACNVLKSLERFVFPVIGEKHVAEVTKSDVWDVIRAIKTQGIYETASRVLQRIGSVFDYAIIVRGFLEHNPTVGIAKFIKKPPEQRDRHYPALKPQEMPDFLLAYADACIKQQTRLATRLLMLTAVRTSELINAKWPEFDLEARQWAIPKERMKMHRDHVVPLSDQAIETLEEARFYCRNSEYVLPGRNSAKKSISNNTILFSIYKAGYRGRMTGHGFRSVFSTYLHALKNKKGQRVFHSDAVERQLAHVEGNKTKAAYDRNQHIEERTRMMQHWANTCDQWAGSNVVPLHKFA